jgi:N-methylhydantoinase B
VTVRGDELTVDFTGTAEQRPGCINTGAGVSAGFAFMGVKAALDPKGPINSGILRLIQVIAPGGSCLNAWPPAACGGLAELGQAMVITVVAVSGLVPDQVSAEEGASANHQNFDGIDLRPGRGRYVFYAAISGGGRRTVSTSSAPSGRATTR